MRRLIFVLAMISFVSFSFAQDMSPTLAETLEAVIAAAAQASTESQARGWPLDGYIRQVAIGELTLRLRSEGLIDQPFALIKGAYDVLHVGQDAFSGLNSLAWNEALVLTWLRENPTPTEHTNVPELDALVQPRDFDNDGTDELTFFIDGDFHAILVTQRDGNRWHLVETPLPFGYRNTTYWMGDAGRLSDLAFGDVNADGLPEWRVIYGGLSCSNCAINFGHLYVLAWRDGALRDISSAITFEEPLVAHDDPAPLTVTWDFTGAGIVEWQDKIDTLNCHWKVERRWTWNESVGLYEHIGDSLSYAESFECGIRAAEKAMWAHEYEAAALLYPLALSRPRQSSVPYLYDAENETAITAERNQYSRLRYASALALTGQMDQASAVIDTLRAETPESQLIADMTGAISEALPSAYQVCAALYNLFSMTYGSEDYYEINVPSNLALGYIRDNFFPSGLHHFEPIDPARVGCDIEKFIEPHIQLYGGTPADELNQLGLMVADSLEIDMDGDGRLEWVVWLTADIPALVYSRSNDSFSYTITRAMVVRDGDQVIPAEPPNQVGEGGGGPEESEDTEISDTQIGDYDLSYDALFAVQNALDSIVHDPAAALIFATDAGVIARRIDSSSATAFAYVGGLALEELGRLEDARAEFKAIIDSAPDSPWAVLAKLHVSD